MKQDRNTPAYRRMGSGPSVVLLHGIPGSGRSWDKVAGQLRDRFDVIIPDLLGFGSSPRPVGLEALHAEAQASGLAALLDGLGVAKAAVVGHDFGGPAAILLAQRRPDLISHLGLLATNAFTDTPIPFPLSLVNWPVVGAAAPAFLFSKASLRMMLQTGAGKPKVRLDPGIYLGDGGQLRSIRTIFQGSLTDLGRLYGPVQEALGAIRVPSFVGWGDADPFFSLSQGRRTAKALGARFQVYPGAGHFLPEERPGEVAAGISNLVDSDVPLR